MATAVIGKGVAANAEAKQIGTGTAVAMMAGIMIVSVASIAVSAGVTVMALRAPKTPQEQLAMAMMHGVITVGQAVSAAMVLQLLDYQPRAMAMDRLHQRVRVANPE
ncbi:hypothetical protein GCM10023115_21190 [Pontixanthobacter gangjinensis]